MHLKSPRQACCYGNIQTQWKSQGIYFHRVIRASMDIASGPHWSKPSDFKGGAEGNLLSQAWLVLPSACPVTLGPPSPTVSTQATRLALTKGALQLLSPSWCSCNSGCSCLKPEIWPSLKLKESNKDIEALPLRVNRIGSLIEALPLRVNRIGALLKKTRNWNERRGGWDWLSTQVSDKHLWLDQMENPLLSPKSSGQMVLLWSWNTGATIHPSLSYWIYQASWLVSLSAFNQPSPTPVKIKVLYFSPLWLIRKVIIKISFMVQCLAWGWPQIWVV